QIITDVTQYGDNTIYTYGDIVYFVGACLYVIANLRDDGWLWFFPFAGQYGIPPGRIERIKPITVGKGHLLMTECCCPRKADVLPFTTDNDNKMETESMKELPNGDSTVHATKENINAPKPPQRSAGDTIV
ncbi:unnamed protein product, partial [Didymodactylos carnosus]